MEPLVKQALNLEFMHQLGGPGGGCLCAGQGYSTNMGPIYMKYCNKPREQGEIIFDGEFASLSKLYDTNTVKVPKPLQVCKSSTNICLVTEYLNMDNLTDNVKLGCQLADLHQYNSKQKDHNSVHEEGEFVDRFGFDIPTCCGIIPQPNEWRTSWVEFFTEQKLQSQVEMLLSQTGDRDLKEYWPLLLRQIPSILTEVEPSLLHGDLWGGNVAQVGADPVIFDPASFYGHSEYDLAISMMFGGFSQAFFNAYYERCPKLEGFDKRMKLYKLFHYLNHWNHFGSGYKSQSMGLMKELSR